MTQKNRNNIHSLSRRERAGVRGNKTKHCLLYVLPLIPNPSPYGRRGCFVFV